MHLRMPTPFAQEIYARRAGVSPVKSAAIHAHIDSKREDMLSGRAIMATALTPHTTASRKVCRSLPGI